MSKKQLDKAASKLVEDKTFGLKNKNKSKKVQAYVQSVQKQVDHKLTAAKAATKTKEQIAAEEAKKIKAAAAAAEKELQALLRSTVKQPKLEAGVDPKSVVCEFFKAGVCDKGDKCKFSHDLALTRRAAKRDVYADTRTTEDDKKADGIEGWDQAKLEEVVKTKHGAEKRDNKTEIVCMYFLDALERELYGWFWNGSGCKYRHALPPGYKFVTRKQREAEAAMRAAEAADTATIEELIEEERKKLPTTGLTPVTAESFARWKETRAKRKADELEARRVEEAKKTGTKGYSALSGRALFSFDPTLFKDDDAADETLEFEEDEQDGSGSTGGAGDAGAAIDEALYLEGGDADLDAIGDDDEGHAADDAGDEADERSS